MLSVTEPMPAAEFPSVVPDLKVQCSLCLHNIILSQETFDSHQWVKCTTCGYNQPLRKVPSGKDMAIFGAIVGGVYLATIIAVLIIR